MRVSDEKRASHAGGAMRFRYPLLVLGLMVLAVMCSGVVAAPARAAAITWSDSNPPTTFLSSSPAAPNGDSKWFSGAAPLVTLTASDPESSATTTYYSWDTDPGAPGQGWSLYGGTLTVPSDVHTLYCYSSDSAGNVEDTQRQAFKVDVGTTAPTVSTPTGVESTSTPIRGTIACDSTAFDDLSGVNFVSFWLFDTSDGGWSGVGTQVGADQTVPFTGTTYRASWDTSGVRDGRYRLQSQSRDVAGNTAWSEPQYLSVDNDGPTASITKPAAGDAIGGSYAITGTEDDPNLAGWTLQIREVGAGSWKTVASGSSSVVGGTLFSLVTAGYSPGSYQLQLVATDTAGNTSADLVTPFVIDTAKPTVVSAAATGRKVVDVLFSEDLAPRSIGRTSFTIPGLTITAATLQADSRTVALSTSDQTSGASYAVSVAGASPTAVDLAGNTVGSPNTAAFTGSTVDSTPPTVPTGLTATSGYDKNQIAWPAVLDPDVAGYNVYRASSADGAFAKPINSAPLTKTSFTDALYGSPGVYDYKVSAVDTAGNESAKSTAIAADTVGISETVGSGGATLTSSTGEITVVIPAGALSSPVAITMVEKPRPANMGPFTFSSRAFELLPAGQTFGSDVSITVAYEPGGLDGTTMRLVYDKAGQWTLAEGGTSLGQAGNTVTGRVKHFADFAVASTDTTPPTISSVTPANLATDVSVADFVTVVFSEPMDPGTLNKSTMQVRTGGVAATPISLDTVVFSADKKTAYLYPDRMLDVKTTYGVWVSGAGVTDLAGNPLGDLMGNPPGTDFTTAFTTAFNGVSPHDGYGASTDLCRNCHAVHGAVGPSLFVEAGEKQVCYSCHDGTGSSYNVKTSDNTSSPSAWDFGEATVGATSDISYHPVPTATKLGTNVTMLCSNCHNAHSMTGTGARFLVTKKLDPSYSGAYRPATGNLFCWTCHNKSALDSAGYISTASWDKSTGFDHKMYYSAPGEGHNMSSGSLVNLAVPSKENIACKGCHSEHGTTNDKLIAEKVNGVDVTFKSGLATDYNRDYNRLCLACHGIAGTGGSYWASSVIYSTSGHGDPNTPAVKTLKYAPNDPTGTLQLQVNLCKQCHEPHGAGDAGNVKPYPNLTRLFEENVCYRCHGSAPNPVGARNIQTEFEAASSHDLGMSTNASRKHDQDAEEAQPVSGAGNSLLSGAKRHVECADCHNAHEAKPSAPHLQGTNLISGVLAGVWGVDAATPGAAWSDPSGWEWSKESPATAEYQLCFKCHSATAYGATPPDKTQVTTPAPSATFWNSSRYTDQSREFNPNNASYHMVWSGPSGTSQVPRTVTNFTNGWKLDSQMYCTDCHKSSTLGAPKGAHGSDTPWVLGGYEDPEKAQYVTGNNNGALYGSQAARDADFEFCFGCHSKDFTGTGFTNVTTNVTTGVTVTTNLHTAGAHLRACTNCHVAVPHGSNRKHLLYFSRGATIDPAPYNDHAGDTTYGLPSTMNIDRASGAWVKEDCNGSGSVCHGA